jgi:phytoene synthase
MTDPKSHEATLRKADYDRYLAAMLAPSSAQPHLFALYAFNYEVARIAESVREPMAGHIRLQWWRDAIEGAYARNPLPHPVVHSLADLIAAHDPPRELFQQLLDAREYDLEEMPFADTASLETYADATSGHVMRLAARILGADASLDDIARGAGTAYALAGLLRALPYHSAQRRLMLPLSILKETRIEPEEVFAGDARDRMPRLIDQVARHAEAHFTAARQGMARRLLTALLPAAVVPEYLRGVTRSGFDPFRDPADVPHYRRQLAMAGALLRGRL